MSCCRLICIGKIKTGYWKSACEYYAKQIRRWRKLSCLELKDGSANIAGRVLQEGERILAALSPRDEPILLAENGKMLTSPEFADLLRMCDERLQKCPAFIIGGPYGVSQAVMEACKRRLSLSRMTWPHELARVLLLEQIYRAENILHNTPYHH